MTTLPPLVPPLPKAIDRNRHLPARAAFGWLARGWMDLWTQPVPSLLYGLGVAAICALAVWAMTAFGWDQVLFPALAGILILGPALAAGLYEKSRRIAAGEPFTPLAMLRPGHGAGYHILFIGAVLCTLMLVWMRAAVLLFALFWGWRAFPGFDQVTQMLIGTPNGWGLLIVGTLVGGLFAALGFAISAFSIPALIDRKLDAFTAMGLSMTYVWHNLPVMLVWGGIVLALWLVGFATAFAAFIVVFPWLGHATWHAYQAIKDPDQ
ncbi:DUF2189 domain-containing protein [Pelagibacterium halotolerans]|uniref:DUF2189 domain-containing protein n=1 Tax=Pelagibacterium halotolerans TaxID=531813 RepID=UPI00384D58C1